MKKRFISFVLQRRQRNREGMDKVESREVIIDVLFFSVKTTLYAVLRESLMYVEKGMDQHACTNHRTRNRSRPEGNRGRSSQVVMDILEKLDR